MKHPVEAIGPEGFGNYLVEWTPLGPQFTRVLRKAHGVLVPGFVDIHCHGAFGIDFMSATTEALYTLIRGFERCGYEGIVFTTVAAPAQDVLAAVERLPDLDAVRGFHLEGPFINPAMAGAQPAAHLQSPPAGPSEWDSVFDHPLLRIVTLAPELTNALELTIRLMSRGVIVSLGHSNATFEESSLGAKYGARHTTHTFNAMRPFHHREPGLTGYALASEALDCELIYDRHHVSPEAASLLLKCRGVDHIIAVSDSTCATGLPPGTRLSWLGEEVVVGKGEVHLVSGGLAGSAITLLEAFQNLAADFGVEQATRMCCLNPRKALGITESPRVWVELDEQHEMVAVHRLVGDSWDLL